MSSADYHRLGGWNDKHLFVTVLKAGKFKIKVLTDAVLGEGPLPGLWIGRFFFFWVYWVFTVSRSCSTAAMWGLVLLSTGSQATWASAVAVWGLSGCSSRGLEPKLCSAVVVHELRFSAACRIFPDQGSNLCLLHWRTDSLPLSHQGSPTIFLNWIILELQYCVVSGVEQSDFSYIYSCSDSIPV